MFPQVLLYVPQVAKAFPAHISLGMRVSLTFSFEVHVRILFLLLLLLLQLLATAAPFPVATTCLLAAPATVCRI